MLEKYKLLQINMYFSFLSSKTILVSPFTNDMAAGLTLIETRDVGHCQMVTTLSLTHSVGGDIMISRARRIRRRNIQASLQHKTEFSDLI